MPDMKEAEDLLMGRTQTIHGMSPNELKAKLEAAKEVGTAALDDNSKAAVADMIGASMKKAAEVSLIMKAMHIHPLVAMMAVTSNFVDKPKEEFMEAAGACFDATKMMLEKMLEAEKEEARVWMVPEAGDAPSPELIDWLNSLPDDIQWDGDDNGINFTNPDGSEFLVGPGGKFKLVDGAIRVCAD